MERCALSIWWVPTFFDSIGRKKNWSFVKLPTDNRSVTFLVFYKVYYQNWYNLAMFINKCAVVRFLSSQAPRAILDYVKLFSRAIWKAGTEEMFTFNVYKLGGRRAGTKGKFSSISVYIFTIVASGMVLFLTRFFIKPR